jgi:predicted RNA binding protein YcfA (HicA-like mRNA interferase family)
LKTPRKIRAKDLIKFLSDFGYIQTRQKGSHIRLSKLDGSHHITIPNHEPLKIGTLNSIINDLSNHMGIKKYKLIELISEL